MKTALALVGACAALSIVVPPLAGLLNGIGSVTLLALGGYSAYRAWAWLESVVEASRRPTTVRRNLSRSEPSPEPRPARSKARSLARDEPEPDQAEPLERRLSWPRIARWPGSISAPGRER
ncbi:MAG TPA: hypothetical protein VNH20_01875 [Candidatus Dormibacteraeota bacterium]|nr:hypothetical protein [Candidatus Dormibacteraeota bacterium]